MIPTNPIDRAVYLRGYRQAAADILAKMTDAVYPRAPAAWREGYAERIRLEGDPRFKEYQRELEQGKLDSFLEEG